MSDGHHVLFIDISSQCLCLGSDTPTGHAERLSRKFYLEPPGYSKHADEGKPPTVYAACADTSRGVLIAAAYDDKIVLFSVPVDMMRWSRAEQEATFYGPGAPHPEQRYVRLLRHPTSNAQALIDSSADTDIPSKRFDTLNLHWAFYLPLQPGCKANVFVLDIWPRHIKGVTVGTLDGVGSLAVQEDEDDGLVVWAFAESGVAKAWQVDNGRVMLSRSAYKATTDGILYKA